MLLEHGGGGGGGGGGWYSFQPLPIRGCDAVVINYVISRLGSTSCCSVAAATTASHTIVEASL